MVDYACSRCYYLLEGRDFVLPTLKKNTPPPTHESREGSVHRCSLIVQNGSDKIKIDHIRFKHSYKYKL